MDHSLKDMNSSTTRGRDQIIFFLKKGVPSPILLKKTTIQKDKTHRWLPEGKRGEKGIYWEVGTDRYTLLLLLLLLSRFSRVRLCVTPQATDGSPRGSAVPGILRARTLEWVAISFNI